MPFGSLHDQLETAAPDGVGFAIKNGFVSRLVAEIVQSTVADPSFHTDIPLGPVPNVRFSFYIDPSSVALNAHWDLTMNVRATLHPAGQVNSVIVTLYYTVTAPQLKPNFDHAANAFSWVHAGTAAPVVTNEAWEPTDAILRGIGYATRDEFKDKVFYAFEWVNSANLISTITKAIPFPQLHRNFGLFQLLAPFETAIFDDYVAVWTKEVTLIGGPCDQPQPSSRPAPAVHTNAVAAGPKSRHDPISPELVLYGGASKLASWYAERFAPAIAYSDSGGGFVKWSVDGTLALHSVDLWLSPSTDGGILQIRTTLRLTAQGNSWIDGPCGSRLSLVSGTIEANGIANVDITPIVDWPAPEVDLVIDVDATVDPTSVHLTGGDLVGAIVGQIGELIIHAFPSLVTGAYHKRTRTELFDLADLGLGRLTALRRIGAASMAIALVPDG